MSDSPTRLPLLASPVEDKTRAGNYFVSNYPPFSFWTPERVGEIEQAMDQPARPETTLGLYLHIPFCRKRCHFCYFKVYTDKNAREIRDYLDAVIEEARMVSQRPFLQGRRPRYVYFGGGTPSYLSVEQLQYLIDGVREVIPWTDVEEFAFECEPGTLNEKKLAGLKAMGVTRLSLGIENFNDELLKLNNRAHESKQVYAAYEQAQAAGFPQINIDLIAGMLDETDDNWRRCIDETLRLQPDSVTIYQMEIPFNTTIYKEMRESGKEIAPVADWPTKRRWVEEAFAALEADGYHLGSAYTAVKGQRTAFLYRDELWHGADLVSLGVSSFGQVQGVHYQNESKMENYLEAVRAGRVPTMRALAMTEDERLIREFILQLKLGATRRDYFIQRFGVDPAKRFADELKALQDAGVLSIDDQTINLNRAGLMQVDRLLHGFFLPAHRDVRYT